MHRETLSYSYQLGKLESLGREQEEEKEELHSHNVTFFCCTPTPTTVCVSRQMESRSH